MTNTVTKWQIISRDPESTARFYASLFRWKVDSGNALGYREVSTGNGSGPGFDGGIWPAGADGQDMVQLFVEVDDVAGTLDRAVKMGARVIVPRSALPDGDTIAVLLDPQGIAFGLMERRSTGS
jgi:predicted enzyme related to lactoylglutathione lyase